jgi:hypothetical protein
MNVFKDKTTPWPAKAYYVLDNYRFVVSVMKQIDDHKKYLNDEVRGFVDNPHMQLYKLTDITTSVDAAYNQDPYYDLRAPSNSSQSFEDPFSTPRV